MIYKEIKRIVDWYCDHSPNSLKEWIYFTIINFWFAGTGILLLINMI